MMQQTDITETVVVTCSAAASMRNSPLPRCAGLCVWVGQKTSVPHDDQPTLTGHDEEAGRVLLPATHRLTHL